MGSPLKYGSIDTDHLVDSSPLENIYKYSVLSRKKRQGVTPKMLALKRGRGDKHHRADKFPLGSIGIVSGRSLGAQREEDVQTCLEGSMHQG